MADASFEESSTPFHLGGPQGENPITPVIAEDGTSRFPVQSKPDIGNDVTFDMTSRKKTSQANNLFSVLWNYDKQPNIFAESTTGGALVSGPGQKDPTYVKLEMSTLSGDEIIFQTKRFLRYQPHREHEVSFAFVFNAGDANQDTRVGQFTNFNGLYWAQLGGVFNIGYRNNTFELSGTIETNVDQANWNYDKLDGQGPSGLDFFSGGATRSLGNTVTFYIRYVFHGSNGVEWGIEYFNRKVPVHRLEYTGSDNKPFMRSSFLPFRVHSINNGVLSAATTSYLGPASLDVHKGQDSESAYRHAVSMGTTTKNVNSAVSYTNLIALRPQAVINLINNRTVLLLNDYNIYTSNDIYFEVLVDCNVIGGTWNNVPGGSFAEFNVGTFTFTGGRVVETSFAGAGTNNNKAVNTFRSFADDLFSAINTVTGVQEAIVVRALKFSSNASTAVGLGWREVY